MARPSVRNQIVEAGMDQFHRIGYNGCSVEDITSAAGVPKGSFYNHFKSKEDLAVEVIGLYFDSAPDVLRHTSIPPLKRLKQHFALLARDFVESGFKRGCLLGNFAIEMADHSPAVQNKLKISFGAWVDALAAVIKEGQDAGDIDARQKPGPTAGNLLSAYQGALLRARAENDPTPLKDFNTVAFAQLTRGSV